MVNSSVLSPSFVLTVFLILSNLQVFKILPDWQFYDTKDGRRDWLQKSWMDFFGVAEMLLSLLGGHWTVYWKWVHFIICKLYFNIVDLRQKPMIEFFVVHSSSQPITSFCEGHWYLELVPLFSIYLDLLSLWSFPARSPTSLSV